KQLYERTDKSSSSIDISSTFSFWSSSFSTIISAFCASSVKFTKIFKCSVKILAPREIDSSGVIDPSVQTSNVNLSKFAFRSEEHTSELQSRFDLVCRLL